MVKATLTYKNGRKEKVYARDFDELFQHLEGVELKEIDARVISAEDMRQGRQMG